MAVEPAPATTSTVTSGPSWVTEARAAPAPDTSAAPNSVSSKLKMKMISTVSGMDIAKVGSSDTVIRNQLKVVNSFHWNGRASALAVSTHILKKPPMACMGPLKRFRRNAVDAVTASPPYRSSAGHSGVWVDGSARTPPWTERL